jgi:hypothetical protein
MKQTICDVCKTPIVRRYDPTIEMEVFRGHCIDAKITLKDGVDVCRKCFQSISINVAHYITERAKTAHRQED